MNDLGEAVSPVIGVILMVAITVILAAIIAAFTFGLTGQVHKSNSVGATVSQSIPNIDITYIGGVDHPTVDCIKANILNSGSYVTVSGDCSDGGTPDAVVGETYTAPGLATGNPDHVVVVAQFVDGSQQVIVDAYV